MGRRSFAALVLVLLVGLGQSPSAATAAAGYTGKWPFRGYSPSHTAYNPDESLLSTTNADSLTAAWQRVFSTGGSVSQPLVFQGRVYAAWGRGVIALRPQTGKTLWHALLGDYVYTLGISGGLGTSGGVLFAAGENNLYALNAATGTLTWSVPGSFAGQWPIVQNGILYISGAPVGGNFASGVQAFDAATGAKLWETKTQCAVQDPALAAGIVYARDCNATLALDAQTGAVLWTFPTVSNPIVGGGYVYEAGAGPRGRGLYGLNAKTGAIRWFDHGTTGCGAPHALVSGVLYCDSEGSVVAVDGTAGTLRWSRSGVNDRSIAAANGVLYAITDHGLEALDPTTGATLGTFTTAGGAYIGGSVAIADGTIYASAYLPVKGIIAIRPSS